MKTDSVEVLPRVWRGHFAFQPAPRWRRSYRIQDPRFQQVEFGPTEHLSLDIFELIHLALCLTVTPRRSEGLPNGRVIAADSSNEAFEWIACSGFRLFDPSFQAALFPGSQELAKALRQF